jgi:saccharopine dehydrogenase-like NADP-dependent oxidoreductase
MRVRPETICLLGGYGDVGLRLARLLHDQTQFTIVLAGRNADRADTAARSVGPRCRGMALDVHMPGALAQLAGVVLCVNLTEATPPRLAATLIANGTHFIDSAATPAYVTDLRRAIGAVRAPRGMAVLETGLAPGLTNLLAHRMCQVQPETRSIDILIEMGMGTHHGIAATEWSLQALAQTYPMKSGGQWQDIRTGTISRRFATDRGRIRGIGFAFSDQASIARDLNLDGARTFLAIDPGWMTRVMGWLSRSPLRNMASRKAGPLARIMQRLPAMGGTETRLTLEGRNARNEVIATHSLTGGVQADMTATVIAQVVQEVLRPTAAAQPGLQALDALLDPASVSERPFGISGFDL